MKIIMTQPEVGKKIAELRKAKGLTQEELVQKCNLNVRTLQRIESGEVMPRSYTVKSIFSALDYDSEFPTDENEETESLKSKINRWFELIYKFLIDLLNLRKDTMKKLSILSLLAITALCFVFTIRSNAQDNKQLVGTWKLEKAIYNGGKFSVSGESFKKLNADGTFENYKIVEGQKQIRETGKYALAGGAYYVEVFTTTSDGKKSTDINSFRYTINGDALTINGSIYLPINNSGNILSKWVIDETWKKVK